ncbi:HNH endonuclease signature motif containing protein [Pseudonocardia sp. GCM10023141]|uniref:HNH endonuclease signature motif containing protein n=1 Tax=Pseudonocardia sp. GCM10023141 TaxID=3252653 RepID=UPI00360E8273
MSTAWQASDEEILHGLATIEKKTNLLRFEGLALVREAEVRGLAGAHGYNTTNELLQCTQNITKAEARRRITAAKDVLPGRSPSGDALPAALPETAKAFAEGAISAEHITVIQRTLGGLKPDLEPHRAELESYLAAHARVFNPYELGVLARRRLAFLDPDGAAPRDTPPTQDHLTFTANGEGFDLRGWLNTESAADLNTALSPLAAPQPAEDGTPDPRTKTERDADALVDLARRSLTCRQLPVDGGERPHINVTITLQDLENRLGTGLRDFGDGSMTGPISAEDARRHACDAEIIPIVLGGNSEPLDIGRSQRVVPRWMRRALAQRDSGCAFPGCTAAAPWCSSHHIIHWARGGITALSNLVLLCTHHHMVMHKEEWEVTITDGFPLFHPPPWIPGGPRRNQMHRIDLPISA